MPQPAGWTTASIGETCGLRYGKFVAKKDLDGGGYPVFSGYGVVGTHSEYLYEDRQLIMVCRGVGGSGDVKLSPPKCWITNLAIVIQPDESNVLKSYLYWALNATDRSTLITGSAQHQVTIAHLVGHKFQLPPLPEQRRIAAILGALDDKIELNRKMNRTLEEMAQALFKSWFIDFDGHDPEGLVDSELGPIPRGWDISTLRHHISLDKGLSYKGDFLTEHGVPMVNLKCVRPHGGFRRDAVKPYSGEYRDRHVVHAGDVILSNTDLTQARDILGCPAFVPRVYAGQKVITSHHTFAVRFTPQSRIGRQFLYDLLLTEPARMRCRGFATGTTVLAVPQDAILDLKFALPPLSDLTKYEEAVGALRERAEINEEESVTLAELRDTLLPKLISGEIRVPEAEDAVEAAL